MSAGKPIDNRRQVIRQVITTMPTILGNDALNFFLDSFKKQGWLGNSFTPWPQRKAQTKWGKTKRNKGRAILIDSGRLRRGTRITNISGTRVVIGNDAPYARAHNEGLRIGLIQQVKSFPRKNRNRKFATNVKAHTRRVNMQLPKRQFMGASPYLEKQLTRRLTAAIMRFK